LDAGAPQFAVAPVEHVLARRQGPPADIADPGGPALSTIQLFDARGNEFPLFENVRRTRDEGHETGVHAWDHRQWQDRLLGFPPAKTSDSAAISIESPSSVAVPCVSTYAIRLAPTPATRCASRMTAACPSILGAV